MPEVSRFPPSDTAADLPLLSVVLPCYNEEEVIGETIKRLRQFCAELLGLNVEMIFVNNGSSDRTWEILKSAAGKDARIKLISLSRNFGYQISTTAGIDAARGDAVVLMDADLQDPPEVIHQMILKWREGYDVVYGTRSERLGESTLRLFVTGRFYRLLNRLSDVSIPLDTGDFRLMSRKVVDTLKSMPERDRFIRGMVSWIGMRQIALPYQRAARFAGTSKFPWRKMFSLATDAIISFSTVPLRLAIAVGMACATIAAIGIVCTLFIRIFTDEWIQGWAALMIGVLLMGGTQLIFMGILGEYIGRMYGEVKRRPLYVVQELVGFEIDARATAKRSCLDLRVSI